MKRLVITIVALVTIVTISSAVDLAADKKLGSIKLSAGQASFDRSRTLLYTLELSGNYYYDNGVMWGASFGIGYAENPDTTVATKAMGEINGNFKLGYSFGQTAKGVGIYGIVDMSYLMYNYTDTGGVTGVEDDTSNYASGFGYGVGAEYLFDSGWLITTSYTTINMSPDIGSKYDYDKALVGVGYSW